MLIVFTLVISLLAVAQPKPARPESLPKIVWTYQEDIDANFVHTLCLHRLRKVLEDSRWVLQVLTPSNIFIYLHQHEEYKLMLRNHRKYFTFAEEIQVAKVLILQQYGGIWVDPDIILLEPVDWIHQLSQEPHIQKYQNSDYEMVVFSSQNYQSDTQILSNTNSFVHPSLMAINLDVLLALKQSPIMTKWKAELSKQFQSAYIDLTDGVNRIKELSKQVFATILQQNEVNPIKKMREYKIWKVQQKDYFYEFKTYSNSQNQYALADLFIKYPHSAIQQNFRNSKHFVSLSQVSNQLNQILNPNISKLSYLNNNEYFRFFNPQMLKCAHYLDEQSIVYVLLIKDTRFEQLVEQIVDRKGKMSGQCASATRREWFTELFVAIFITVCIIFMYVILKIQKLCLQLLLVKAKVFFRPRILLMLNILKTIKRVIQYSANNGI